VNLCRTMPVDVTKRKQPSPDHILQPCLSCLGTESQAIAREAVPE
jgi:hypothetical protein